MDGRAVTLIFESGESRQISVGPFETVEQAARRQGIGLLTDCREGACGTCKAKCLSGEYQLNDHSTEALPDGEASARIVLTCQMRVVSPCVVEFDYPFSKTSGRPAAPLTTTLRSLERASDTVMCMRLEAAGGERLCFLPGQYVNIVVPDTLVSRAYSFANAPDHGEFAFYVRLLEGGAMGDYLLRRARPGDRVELRGPLGRFFLRDPSRPLLIDARGSGLAPMLGMLRHLAETQVTHPSIHLIYGANRPLDLFALDELSRLQSAIGSLKIVICVTDKRSDWTGSVGLVGDVSGAQNIDFTTVDTYLCGPPPMIAHAETILRGRGARTDRIFAERFVLAQS